MLNRSTLNVAKTALKRLKFAPKSNPLQRLEGKSTPLPPGKNLNPRETVGAKRNWPYRRCLCSCDRVQRKPCPSTRCLTPPARLRKTYLP
jgi:hypothetical protein